jgi:hypothetical protein
MSDPSVALYQIAPGAYRSSGEIKKKKTALARSSKINTPGLDLPQFASSFT